MTHALRHALAAVAGPLALVVFGSACAGAAREAGAVGTSGGAAPALGIETSSFFVTVENRSGQPLIDVRVAIDALGNLPPFTSMISRLESGEKRDISMGDFRTLDGTNFNRRMKAKRIVVTAADLGGNRHEVTKPWQ